MTASRVRTMGASSAPFWFSAFFLALMPTSIGYQDLAALLARQPGLSQPGVSQRWHDHLIASPFGTIEPATFSYGRPIGTSVPLVYQTVNFDPGAVAANSWQIHAPLNATSAEPVEYPIVNRRLKGDRLPVLTPAAPATPEALPQLQPVNAPAAAPAPVQPRPPAPSFIMRLKSAEAIDAVPPMAQPAQLPPSAPVLQLAEAEPPNAALRAMSPPTGRRKFPPPARETRARSRRSRSWTSIRRSARRKPFSAAAPWARRAACSAGRRAPSQCWWRARSIRMSK